MTVLIRGAKIFLNFIFCFFKLFPVADKITFISRQSDEVTLDIQLLADEFHLQAPDYQCVYLCKRIGSGYKNKVLYVCHLFRQMYHIATSQIVILDSYCMGVSLLKQRKSLVVIQMWHALGALKKFGKSILDTGEGHGKKFSEAMNMHQHYDLIFSSSALCAPHFAEAFGYPLDHVQVASLPRVDVLTDFSHQDKIRRNIYKQYPILKERETIVYAPTFRKDSKYNKEAMEHLIQTVDLKRYNLVVKGHPLMQMQEYEGISGILCDKDFSTIDMFTAADYIIVDYSAVLYEAALMKKPLFFYTYDMEQYQTNRDFYLDYEQEMPGMISADAGEIMNAITAQRYNLDEVAAFADRYIEIQENCTKDMADKILKVRK